MKNQAINVEFTKTPKSIEKALAAWHNCTVETSDSTYDELTKTIERENDIYSSLSLNIFIHDNFLNNQTKFCNIIDKIYKIDNSSEMLNAIIDEIKKQSSYVDEQVNIAFYLFLKSRYSDDEFNFKTIDAVLNQLADELY